MPQILLWHLSLEEPHGNYVFVVVGPTLILATAVIVSHGQNEGHRDHNDDEQNTELLALSQAGPAAQADSLFSSTDTGDMFSGSITWHGDTQVEIGHGASD